VFIEEVVFVARTKHIATGNQRADLECLERGEVPILVLVERRDINTTRYEYTL